MGSPLTFQKTRHQINVLGTDRPVLKLGKRLFVGETLSLVNPNGFGGRVWSAMNLDLLKYNANLGRHNGPGH